MYIPDFTPRKPEKTGWDCLDMKSRISCPRNLYFTIVQLRHSDKVGLRQNTGVSGMGGACSRRSPSASLQGRFNVPVSVRSQATRRCRHLPTDARFAGEPPHEGASGFPTIASPATSQRPPNVAESACHPDHFDCTRGEIRWVQAQGPGQ